MHTENHGSEKVAPADSIADAIARWPFEQKMQPVMYEKQICSRAQFRVSARAKGPPDMGEGKLETKPAKPILFPPPRTRYM